MKGTNSELRVGAEMLAEGGLELSDKFMDELRARHRQGIAPGCENVVACLAAAHEKMRAS